MPDVYKTVCLLKETERESKTDRQTERQTERKKNKNYVFLCLLNVFVESNRERERERKTENMFSTKGETET